MVSNIFYFHPYLGKTPIFDSYFSNGLKPPPSKFCQIQPIKKAGQPPQEKGGFPKAARLRWPAQRPSTQVCVLPPPRRLCSLSAGRRLALVFFRWGSFVTSGKAGGESFFGIGRSPEKRKHINKFGLVWLNLLSL